jgi:hypothetical protein
MKALNFASLDPKITTTGRKGLTRGSAADRAAWSLMHTSMDAFEEASASAAAAFAPLLDATAPGPQHAAAPVQTSLDEQLVMPSPAQTEALKTMKQRRKQAFFRRLVLAAYGDSCAVSGIAVPDLLNASHIIPWSQDPSRRLDPTNGIALNTLYDRAFNRGLITFDAGLRVIVSSRLRREPMSGLHKAMLSELAGRQASRPIRFDPDPHALQYHRDTVFKP